MNATLDFAFTADEERLFGLMDWTDLARLEQSMITIGSHTHVDLPQVDDERLEGRADGGG